MKEYIKILHLEDDPTDKELIKETLGGDNWHCNFDYAETEEEFTAHLKKADFDIILADLKLPDYDGFQALELAKELCPDKPFVFVSGEMGEETAVEAIKKGATDYVLKHNLFKLPTVIKRVLIEYDEKEKVNKAEKHIEHLNRVLKSVRNVNQLIVKEKDVRKLIQQSCNNLIENRGYNHAYIGLFDNKMQLTDLVHAGLGESFEILKKYLETNSFPTCWKNTLSAQGAIVIEDVENECRHCPLQVNEVISGNSSLSIKLQHENKFYGFMTVSIPQEFVEEEEEKDLFEEVAGDISYALHSIETAEERELAVSSLIDSEKKFRSIFNNASDSIFIHDYEGNLIEVNRIACERMGYSQQELYSMKIADLISEEEIDKFSDWISTIRTYGRTLQESAAVSKAGNSIPIEISSRAIDFEGEQAILSIARDITERKEQEKQLADREEKYRLLAENTLDIIWQIDLNMIITYISPSCYEVTGYTPEESIGNNVLDFTSQEEARKIMDEYQETVNKYPDKTKKYLETFLYHKDGHIIPIEISARILADENDMPISMQGITRDITERKKAESALRESERRLSTLMSNLPGMAYRCKFDRQYTMEFASEGGYTLTGYQPEELIDNNVIAYGDLILPQYRDYVWDSVQIAVDNDEPFKLEYKIITREGEEKWVWERGNAINVNGKVVLEGFIADITDRKEAEEEIRKSRHDLQIKNKISNAFINTDDFYNAILDVLKEELDSEFGFVGFINDNGDFESPSMTRNVWEDCEVEDKSIVFPKDKWGGIWGQSLKEKKTLFKNKDLNTPEGHVPLHSALVSPILLNDELIGLVAAANKEGGYTQEDINFIKSICTYLSPLFHSKLKEEKYKTDLLEAKERAEEGNRIKSSFLANMSHEMRTPMVGILGFADILYKEIHNEDQKEMAQMILTSGRRLMDTLNLLLDLSRVEADKQELNFEEMSLAFSVLDAVELFSPLAQQKNLSLETEILDENVTAYLDENILVKTVNNLVNNAIKYTNKGKVKVIVDSEDGDQPKAVIKVIDTGIGISAENQKLIFEEFRQVSEGISRSFEGAGLGLTITKKYIEKMNGEIYVESEPNKGSTFTVKFPAIEVTQQEGQPELMTEERMESEMNSQQNEDLPLVLLVEDDISSSVLTERYIKGMCRVEHAANGEKAVEQAKEKVYDAILMDINLGGGMSGMDSVREIRKLPEYKNTPIMALTAFAMKGDKEEFLEGGCTHYLSKPFEREDIIDVLNEMIEDNSQN